MSLSEDWLSEQAIHEKLKEMSHCHDDQELMTKNVGNVLMTLPKENINFMIFTVVVFHYLFGS